ncbi:hypothetical protein AKI39_07870 [Bordetella sp. H567]|uniref:hypothetical protein n=1 Tax=Bordetella sp. H567 TaxID=1697043 RepID=UPI00081C6997|nr:hypothetical protein [Bordetella sp. H567]AOB30625.1 hypothetical protein AKI39_07870 [Bordetella sp. H567]
MYFPNHSASSSPLQSSTSPLPVTAAPLLQVPPPPPSGWIILCPVAAPPQVASGTANTDTALGDRGAVLTFHIAADINRDEEPLMEGLATIGKTPIGQLLLSDLAQKLGNQSITVVRAHGLFEAGLTADAQGALHLAICPDTVLAYGMKMQPHSGWPPFTSQKRYACGLFDLLLCAMNYFETGTYEQGKRIDLHPGTLAFRQTLLDAVHRSPATTGANAPDAAGVRPVGLRVNLHHNMLPYKDGFHRMLTTLRDSEAGNRMLRGFAQMVGTPAIEVLHADHPGDAGLICGHDGVVYWYYHVGSLAAHAALLQTTGHDLTHEQRDACAAFDLLLKSWESLDLGRANGVVKPGDRLDLDYARRSFRNELCNDARGAWALGRGDASAGMRV